MIARFRLSENYHPYVYRSPSAQIRMPKAVAITLVIVGISCLFGCGRPAQIPADLTPLFDPDQKLAANQPVRVIGLIEYDRPGNSSFGRPYAFLRVGVGEFTVLLDANGLQMAQAMDLKTVYVQGYLTGKSTASLHMSLGSPFGGTGSVSRVPELKVEKYRAASPESATARLLDDGLCDELDDAVGTGDLATVKHLITGDPELINMKKRPEDMTFLQEAEANNRKDVAEFLRQHGGHE